MSGSEWALQKAVVATLAADAGVQSVLGSTPRVYDEPPDDVVFPYLTVGRVETADADADEAPAHEHILHLHVWSRYGGRREAHEIVSTVRAALHDASLALEDWRLVNLRATYADVFRAGDGRTTHGILRLRAVVEPLAA